MRTFTTGMYLRGVHLIGVHLRGVHLRGVCLRGVRLLGMHLIGVYVMSVHLRGVRLRCVRLNRRASHRPPCSDSAYRGEACQHLDLDLVDLEVKGHFRIRKVQPEVWYSRK